MSLPYQRPQFNPYKRQRRTATAVLAGAFDPRPERFVLTSLLNGVSPYKEGEKEAGGARGSVDSRNAKKNAKRERERARKKAKQAAYLKERESKLRQSAAPSNRQTSTAPQPSRPAKIRPSLAPEGPFLSNDNLSSSQWNSRPAIQISSSMQRQRSITPPPSPRYHYTPNSTPGPSSSSSTSQTSSKRPRTPADDEELHVHRAPVAVKKKPVRAPPVKKGWKGWAEVEGSPPPSDKLIRLDDVPVLRERKLRSGKQFDGVGPGREDWR